MKPNAFLRFMGATLLFASLLGACNALPEALESEIPQVEFENSQTNLTAVVDEPYTFQAQVVNEGSTTSRWYVNGVLEGSAAEFVYIFPEPGVYTVQYVASNSAGEFTQTFTVTVSDKLMVELSIGDETEITLHQFTELQVGAVVLQGSNVTHQWEIDGVIVSTQVVLEGFMLDEARDYAVVYTGRNDVGEVIIPFTVHVIEAPLTISFTPDVSALTAYLGNTATFTANVTAGSEGMVHRWTVNDVEVSNSSTLDYLCGVEGVFAVTYYGVNAKGEEMSRSWTLTVEVLPYVICDFESLANETSQSLFGNVIYSVNNPGLEVMDNPYPDNVNSSGKIMKVYVTGTTSTSGYFEIYLNNITPAVPNIETYSKVRFKVYRPFGNQYFPIIQINGGDRLNPVSSPATYDAWETLVYEFEPNPSFSQVTIRPLLDQSGNNITTLGDRTIYIDDIELLQ